MIAKALATTIEVLRAEVEMSYLIYWEKEGLQMTYWDIGKQWFSEYWESGYK